MLLDLDLFVYDLLGDLFSSDPIIRLLPEHHLIANDSKGVIVTGKVMLLAEYDLRAHVLGVACRVLCVVI